MEEFVALLLKDFCWLATAAAAAAAIAMFALPS